MEVTTFLDDFNQKIKDIKGASTDGKSIVVTFCMYNKERISVAQTADGKWQKTPAVLNDCLIIQEPYGEVQKAFVGGAALTYVDGKIHVISIPQIVRIEYAYRIENETILNKLNVPASAN